MTENLEIIEQALLS